MSLAKKKEFENNFITIFKFTLITKKVISTSLKKVNIFENFFHIHKNKKRFAG